MLQSKRIAILAKIQPVAGTAVTPDPLVNGVLLEGLATMTPIEAKTDQRNLVRPYFGAADVLVSQVNSKLEYTVELAGSGTPGQAPAFGTLLRGCGFAEILTPSVKVEYLPISSGQEMLTLYYYLDGIQHVIADARGTVSFDFTVDKRPTAKFVFTGSYSTPTDVTLPNVALANWITPITVNKTNTPTFSVLGYAAALSSFSADIANTVVYRSLPNSTAQTRITDRQPSGSVLFEATKMAEKDWWTSVKNGTSGALQLIHGTTAGNIVQIDCPRVVMNPPTYQDQEGVTMLNAKLSITPSAGNDEFKLTLQ